MVRRVSAEPAAAGPDAAVGQQQGDRVVVARHDVVGGGAPGLRLRVPDFGREHGGGVAEFHAAVAADDHDLAVGQHDGVVELPRDRHRGDRSDRRGAATQIHLVARGGAGAGGRVAAGRGGRAAARDHDTTFIVHRPRAFLRVVRTRDVVAGKGQRTGAGGGHPVHPVGGAEVEQVAVRREHQEGMPDVDVAGLRGDGGPADAGQASPAGGLVPQLRGVRSAAAADREHAAVGQRHAGVVPARIVHVRQGGPLVGLPIEDAGKPRGRSAAVHHQPSVRQQRGAAAEHVVAVVVHLRELPGRGIPHGGVGELRAAREGGALVGREGQQPAVRQQRCGDGNVRRPCDDGAPGASRRGAGGERLEISRGGVSSGCLPAAGRRFPELAALRRGLALSHDFLDRDRVALGIELRSQGRRRRRELVFGGVIVVGKTTRHAGKREGGEESQGVSEARFIHGRGAGWRIRREGQDGCR